MSRSGRSLTTAEFAHQFQSYNQAPWVRFPFICLQSLFQVADMLYQRGCKNKQDKNVQSRSCLTPYVLIPFRLSTFISTKTFCVTTNVLNVYTDSKKVQHSIPNLQRNIVAWQVARTRVISRSNIWGKNTRSCSHDSENTLDNIYDNTYIFKHDLRHSKIIPARAWNNCGEQDRSG